MSADDQPEGRRPNYQRPRSPEEIAQEFFRSGGVVVPPEVPDIRPRRSRVALARAVGIAVVLALLVAVAVLASSKKSAPPSHSGVNDPTTSTTSTTTSTTTTTTVPLPPDSAVTVDVLNASGGGELATETAAGLKKDGFGVSGIDNAPFVIPTGDPSKIFYGPGGLPAAQALSNSLSGPRSLAPSTSLTGDNVTLWIAGPGLTVNTTP